MSAETSLGTYYIEASEWANQSYIYTVAFSATHSEVDKECLKTPGESGAAMYDGVDAARLAAQKDFTLRVAALIDSLVDFDGGDRWSDAEAHNRFYENE